MHIFDKIKRKMCMSKTSAVIGFRVTLRYAVSHKRTGSISNPCISFISWPCSKIAQVRSRLEERHLLHKSEGAEAEDCKEIPSWIKQLTTFYWWWDRGLMNSFTKRSSMRTGWRWWLPDEPGSTEPIGDWKTHQHSTNPWEHLWQTTFTPSREWWSVCCIQSGGYKPHQDGLSHYHRLHEQVLDFMAEDFHQKWNQMHHSIEVEDGLTKVGNHSSGCVYHSWSSGLQSQRPPCLVCRPLHQCADQRRVHE